MPINFNHFKTNLHLCKVLHASKQKFYNVCLVIFLTFKYNLQINKIITSLGRTDIHKKLKVNLIQTTKTEATKNISQSSTIIYIALI